MKSFIIAMCILVSIIVYILITSIYFLNTEYRLISVLKSSGDFMYSDSSHHLIDTERLNELYYYFKKRNKVLSLYVHRSKCAEIEFLLKEMSVHSQSGNISLYQLAELKLFESLQDIRRNDASLTLNGII